MTSLGTFKVNNEGKIFFTPEQWKTLLKIGRIRSKKYRTQKKAITKLITKAVRNYLQEVSNDGKGT